MVQNFLHSHRLLHNVLQYRAVDGLKINEKQVFDKRCRESNRVVITISDSRQQVDLSHSGTIGDQFTQCFMRHYRLT
jgi:hypothetical protein